MNKERITRAEVVSYKREILEQSVLVTPETAAEMLSVAPRTVRRYIQEGRLATYHPTASRRGKGATITRGTRILAAELRDFVRSIKVDRDALDE